jgi:hypothetical protein
MGKQFFPELVVFLILFLKFKNAAFQLRIFHFRFSSKIQNLNRTMVQMYMLSPSEGRMFVGDDREQDAGENL